MKEFHCLSFCSACQRYFIRIICFASCFATCLRGNQQHLPKFLNKHIQGKKHRDLYNAAEQAKLQAQLDMDAMVPVAKDASAEATLEDPPIAPVATGADEAPIVLVGSMQGDQSGQNQALVMQSQKPQQTPPVLDIVPYHPTKICTGGLLEDWLHTTVGKVASCIAVFMEEGQPAYLHSPCDGVSFVSSKLHSKMIIAFGVRCWLIQCMWLWQALCTRSCVGCVIVFALYTWLRFAGAH